MNDFERAMDFVQFHEGGWANDKLDRGGLTAFGVSVRSFPRSRHPEFWENPTAETARQFIYSPEFWDRYGLDRLPLHIGCIVLDMFVNHGPRNAVRILQRGVGGLKVDGKLGPKTRRKLNSKNVSVSRILQKRLEFYGRIILRDKTQSKFYGGWAWRTQCLGMYAVGLQTGINIKPNGEYSPE